jgi:hypothetical protein
MLRHQFLRLKLRILRGGLARRRDMQQMTPTIVVLWLMVAPRVSGFGFEVPR